MATQYYCRNPRRREAVLTATDEHGSPLRNGIDYLEVASTDQKTLAVHFLHRLPGQTDGVPASPAPALEKENVVIEGGVRIQNVRVESVLSSGKVLTVEVDTAGDFSTYTLRLVSSAGSSEPPEGFDPPLSEVRFSFKVDCPSDFDCRTVTQCPPEKKGPEPPIDYLSKDYASFRQLMLDRLSVIMPDWEERNPADVGVALVEVLAYAADHLSYYQDAVAGEVYLGMARKRPSVRRHARLLDYAMHEGCNARAWVHVRVEAGGVTLEKGTQLLARLAGQETCIEPGSSTYTRALAQQPVVFETMHQATLRQAHNEIDFYTWGDEQCCLPRGATRATLRNSSADPLALSPGDVLVFEEVRGPGSGRAEDADPAHRHAVRLTHVDAGEDPLFTEDGNGSGPVQVVDIQWAPEDALPFPLCLSEVEVPGEPAAGKQPVSIARGNVILADHGRTIEASEQGELLVPQTGRFHPRLQQRDVTHGVPYDHHRAQSRPAAEAIEQDPRAALPQVTLQEGDETWTVQRDLLSSGRFAREFVVEMDEDGSAALRFGDGVLGREPAGGSRLQPIYRVGSGRGGNVGAEAIAHVVTSESGIAGMRNPLPARGGTDPEPVEQVRQYAPQAFRTQERAVTEADYAAAAERHSEVQKGVATCRWTGSWHTMFVTVDRKGGHPVDVAFEAELRAFLERFRLAGHDVEIEPPRFVPLNILLRVCVAPGYYRDVVKEALLETFSNQDLPDGRRGFFHPDHFTFGQSVYLSQVISAAMEVPGVWWVDVVEFHRWGQTPLKEREEGQIPMGRLEIAILDNDPNAPENGKIEFTMEGGL